MNILLTGPSGAGKSALAVQLASSDVVHLDLLQQLPEPRKPTSPPTTVLYEGLPKGSDDAVTAFLRKMDVVLWLDLSWRARLARCHKRDGLAGLGRWLWNERCWHAITLPLLIRHPGVRKISWEPSLD